MTQSELDQLEQKMKERLPCGHTGEEHLAATLIVAGCQRLKMPVDVMVAACRIIGEKEEDIHETDNQPMFMAPAGTA